MDVNLWIVTGFSESGKTTFCQGIIQAARQAGMDAAGLVSPAVFIETSGGKSKIKESIWTEDIRSGEKQLLACSKRQTKHDLVFGNWYFNQNTLKWGNQVLKTSIPCELLVIDELGPLEFYFSQGWMNAMDILQSAQFRLAIVVIRPELLEIAQAKFHPSRTIQIEHSTRMQELVDEHLRLMQNLFNLS